MVIPYDISTIDNKPTYGYRDILSFILFLLLLTYISFDFLLLIGLIILNE